jgi:hypothetical protein
MYCRAKTKSGERCARHANDSGFCSRHDSRTQGEKAAAEKIRQQQKERFGEVLDVVAHTCEIKSWGFSIDSRDEKTWRYATITVWSHAAGAEVTGQLNLIVHDKVSLSCTKTSFYGYGLTDLHQSITNELRQLPWLESSDKRTSESGLDRVINIVNRFHLAANQLRRRYDNRETLRICDEYDVQDLLHVLLKVHFDDVRPEEYAPTKAGAASRLDFLLKSERLVVEVKLATSILTDKKIGEQLIVDIERYKAHPDCDRLVCFVYDPDHHIRNPAGLEQDLSKKDEKPRVIVIVTPK